MTLKRIWVVGAEVAVYGSMPHEFLSPDVQLVAVQCVSFLSRAAYYGAELHVPFVFYSEAMTLAARAVAQGVLDWENARQLLAAAFGTTWEFHIPAWDDVLELHSLSQPQQGRNTHDAEYLAVAKNLNTSLVTTRRPLVERVNANRLEVNVQHIGDHPWSQPGALDAFPPSD